MAKISLIGSGSWGTALALVLLQNGHEVLMYGIEVEQIEQMRRQRQNPLFLPNVLLPETLRLTTDFAAATAFSRTMLLAVPSHAFRSVLRRLAADPPAGRLHIISVAKGIENKTLMRMEEITADVLAKVPHGFVCLSGPSHAEEVARSIPTAIVAASRDTATARKTQQLLMSPYFRVYTHSDVTGVELGGALKNIIALAAGICDGVGFGDNTKAALMTRGLAEITRLGVALGANASTFAGLSGMGDLIVTCMSRHSRNRSVGEQIGKGKSLEEVLAKMVMVAEGVRTTESAYELAQKHGIEMPITEKVHDVLFNKESPRSAVAELMSREAKDEKWGSQ